MRRVTLVVAVIIGVVAITWWLSRDDDAPAAAPSAPQVQKVVEPVAAPSVVAVEEVRAKPIEVTAERRVPVEERPREKALEAPTQRDAGAAEQLESIEVTITVLRDDAPAAGERLRLRPPSGPAVDGVTDEKGLAKLSLSPGSWKVWYPREASPQQVSIGPDTRAVTLRIAPQEVVTGCVVDDEGKPAQATVMIIEIGAEPVKTGDDGCFSTTVRGPTVKLQAKGPAGSSELQKIELPSPKVTLVLHREKSLHIRFQPADLQCANVFLTSKLGVRYRACSTGPCRVDAPLGDFAIEAVATRGGALLFGKLALTAAPESGEVVVPLADAPPITGVVRDRAGVPISGFILNFKTTFGRVLPLPTAITSNDGTFSVRPTLTTQECEWEVPTWIGSAAEGWDVYGVTVVKFGDPPLKLTGVRKTP